MASIGYVRVSSEHQNLGRQYLSFEEHNIKLDKIFEEKISGKNLERPQLQKMLEYIRESDILYVESLSRLGRSTKDLLNIIGLLEEKKVGLVSLKENIDTQSPQGKLVFTIFSALAEFERETIKQRQKEGIDLCLKEGRKYGRPSMTISDNFVKIYNAWRKKEITAIKAYQNLKMPKSSFYKLVRQYERQKNMM